MLIVVEDTTAGIHDTLIAACDKQRYEELGGEEGHRNCADNLVEGLSGISRCFLNDKEDYFLKSCVVLRLLRCPGSERRIWVENGWRRGNLHKR